MWASMIAAIRREGPPNAPRLDSQRSLSPVRFRGVLACYELAETTWTLKIRMEFAGIVEPDPVEP